MEKCLLPSLLLIQPFRKVTSACLFRRHRLSGQWVPLPGSSLSLSQNHSPHSKRADFTNFQSPGPSDPVRIALLHQVLTLGPGRSRSRGRSIQLYDWTTEESHQNSEPESAHFSVFTAKLGQFSVPLLASRPLSSSSFDLMVFHFQGHSMCFQLVQVRPLDLGGPEVFRVVVVSGREARATLLPTYFPSPSSCRRKGRTFTECLKQKLRIISARISDATESISCPTGPRQLSDDQFVYSQQECRDQWPPSIISMCDGVGQ